MLISVLSLEAINVTALTDNLSMGTDTYIRGGKHE